jgi:hypothetical protein
MALPDYKAIYRYQLMQWAKEKNIDFGEIKDGELNKEQEKYSRQYMMEKKGNCIKKAEHAQKAAEKSELRFKGSIDCLVEKAG